MTTVFAAVQKRNLPARKSDQRAVHFMLPWKPAKNVFVLFSYMFLFLSDPNLRIYCTFCALFKFCDMTFSVANQIHM